MPGLPAQKVPAEIGRDGEHPRGKLQFLFEAMSLLKNADKGFLSDIERLCLVAEVAINISRQRQLPPAHQFVEGELLSLSKLNHQLFIRRFSQVYQGLRAFLIYTTQI